MGVNFSKELNRLYRRHKGNVSKRRKKATGGYIFPDSGIPFFKEWLKTDWKDRDWEIRWAGPGYTELRFYD